MISVIICSINEYYFNNLKRNVDETIGVNYELIKINNKIEKLSMCAAYNKGVKLSHYKYVVFVHEDVIFKTTHWGKNLIATFNNDSDINLIGLLGTTYKSKSILGWDQPKLDGNNFTRGNILQGYKIDGKESTLIYFNPLNESNSPVVTIDGVFMAAKRTLLEKIQFNENLVGFHSYDLDFSLQTFMMNAKIVVVYDILIEHYSLGNFNINWVESNQIVYERFKKELPISTGYVINQQLDYRLKMEGLYNSCKIYQKERGKMKMVIHLFKSSFKTLNIKYLYIELKYYFKILTALILRNAR